MANVPQKTLAWLWDVLRREYRDPNRTYSDLAHTLSHYPTFAPRTDVYTFENGSHALLVHLLGNIPVNFRGTIFRFPVEIWVPHAYPYEGPIIYVRPTEDMVVRPGQHVAGDGRIYHHYLANWKDTRDRSNVAEFLAILSDIFAKEPPVVARQQHQRPASQQPQPPVRPPLPHEVQRPPSQTRSPGQPPPPPPKHYPADNRASPTLRQKPGRYDTPPPLPPQPEAPGGPPSAYNQPPQGNGSVHQPRPTSQYMPQRVNSLRPEPQQQPLQQWQPQYPIAPQAQPGPPPHSHPHPNHHMHHQHHQPTHHIIQPQPRHPQQPVPNQPQKPLQPSLLDSPFDIALPVAQQNLPAPPIPRNPEKDALLSHLSSVMTSTLHSQIQQNASALPALHSQNAALHSTIPRLQAELSSLSALQETLKSNINLLQSSMSNADSTISSARRRSAAGDIPKVDDMLVAPHVVGKQLYDTVTEERGLDAAILALQEAFVRGRISSDLWSRRTRELAREGFRRRYLSRKIGTGMGLDR